MTNTRELVLSNGSVAVVDSEDYETLAQHSWTYSNGYAARTVNRTTVYLHRQLMGAPTGLVVDHKNGDTLDNRRSNLRVCTMAENRLNSRKRRGSSQYKGVHWYGKKGKWQAQIKRAGKNYGLGYFASEAEAARAYDAAAKTLHGEFARLNFPEERAA